MASTSNAESSDNLSTAADSFEGPAHAGFVPLSNRSANPEINGDAMFLDAFGNLMDKHDVSPASYETSFSIRRSTAKCQKKN